MLLRGVACYCMLLCGIAWHGKLLNGIAGLAVTRPISRPRLQPCEPAAAAGIAEGRGRGRGRGGFLARTFLDNFEKGIFFLFFFATV